jgi:hypothetical protein
LGGFDYSIVPHFSISVFITSDRVSFGVVAALVITLMMELKRRWHWFADHGIFKVESSE